jgi:hypothetical protein
MRQWIKEARSDFEGWAQTLFTGFKTAMQGVGDVLTSAITQSDGTFKSFFKNVAIGFARMAQDIINELIRIAVYQMILKLIGAAAGGAASGGGGAIGEPGGGFAIPPVAGPRAGGGPVNVGSSYIVGERGWEVFVPNQSGTILNQKQLAELGEKGGSKNQTINIYTRKENNLKSAKSRRQLAQDAAGELQRRNR